MKQRNKAFWKYPLTRFGIIKSVQLIILALGYILAYSYLARDADESMNSLLGLYLTSNCLIIFATLYMMAINIFFKMRQKVFRKRQMTYCVINSLIVSVELSLMVLMSKVNTKKTQIITLMVLHLLVFLFGILDHLYYKKFYAVYGPRRVRFSTKFEVVHFFDESENELESSASGALKSSSEGEEVSLSHIPTDPSAREPVNDSITLEQETSFIEPSSSKDSSSDSASTLSTAFAESKVSHRRVSDVKELYPHNVSESSEDDDKGHSKSSAKPREKLN